MTYTLPELPYAFDALEPHIDAQTMEIHHDKHHAGYVKKLNKALEGNEQFNKNRIEIILANITAIPDEIRTAVRNNGGGHFNHTLFWQILGPNAGGAPTGELGKAVDKSFGSFDTFKEAFTQAATSQFGSGWAWLCVSDNKLSVQSTPNQDSPIMNIYEERSVPILGLDVWEHAYYLKYQNKRAEYVEAFWNVVNWDSVARLFSEASKVEERLQEKILV